MLDAAYAAGIRYVDAARSYGKAEEFLSSWLRTRAISADALTVGSKWGYAYVGDWRMDAAVHEVKDLSAATLRRQFAESRAWLGSHLHVYQIHSATLESGVLDDAAVMGELETLRESGLAIGLTVTGPRQADTIRRALDVRMHGSTLFEVVQATWNLLEPSAGAALAEAHHAGCTVIVKEALANGRLTEHEAPAEVRAMAAAHHLPVDVFALAAAASQPWVDVVLSGAVTTAQLASNLRALAVSLDGDAAWPDLAEPPQEYWNARAARAWA
jgi:aryl-alcohol dehydrogenase-like predicted oxidoreductase